MAGSISKSFNNLSAQINSLAAGFKALGIGVRRRTRLESSSEFKKAIALVGNNAFLTNAYNIQNKAKDIQRAQRAMRSHPGRWKTPDEYLTWEKEQKERRDKLSERERELRKERFDRQQRLSDKILSIDSPDKYRKMMLTREYGEDGAGQILEAEERKEQRLRDSRRSISVRRYQAEAYRKFPWVKTLVDAGMIQKKELPKITKTLSRVAKIPGFGIMTKHPVAAAIGAGIALTSDIFARQDKANKTVTDWEASEAIFGKPSKAFESAMMKAGMSYQDVLNAWAKMSMKYGDPDLALPMLGAKLSGIKPGIERGTAATAMWLDQKMAKGAMVAAGTYTPSNAAEVNAEIERLNKISDVGWRSGATLGEKARAAMLRYLPWEKDLEARGLSGPDIISQLIKLNPITSPLGHAISGVVPTVDELRSFDEAQEAARSADEYERNKATGSSKGDESTIQGGNQVTMNVNEIRILEAKDIPGMLLSIASKALFGYNIDVMNWADSRRVKV